MTELCNRYNQMVNKPRIDINNPPSGGSDFVPPRPPRQEGRDRRPGTSGGNFVHIHEALGISEGNHSFSLDNGNPHTPDADGDAFQGRENITVTFTGEDGERRTLGNLQPLQVQPVLAEEINWEDVGPSPRTWIEPKPSCADCDTLKMKLWMYLVCGLFLGGSLGILFTIWRGG